MMYSESERAEALRQAALRQVEAGFEMILKGLGISDTEHTKGTPLRAAKAWANEICAGLTQPPPKITTFDSNVDAMVVLADIPIKSLCAHHLLPFTGTAAIAYVPGKGKILGLSKLSRIADYWARRPQVQEELTNQIADALAELVMDGDDKGGVGVLIKCNHQCMELRGVQHAGNMKTCQLRGVLRKPEARDEFFRMAGI
jgi:GTP cyclohydrolase IA